jgi:hypothetical protein
LPNLLDELAGLVEQDQARVGAAVALADEDVAIG